MLRTNIDVGYWSYTVYVRTGYYVGIRVPRYDVQFGLSHPKNSDRMPARLKRPNCLCIHWRREQTGNPYNNFKTLRIMSDEYGLVPSICLTIHVLYVPTYFVHVHCTVYTCTLYSSGVKLVGSRTTGGSLGVSPLNGGSLMTNKKCFFKDFRNLP